jgi:PIN domain nuclease of toxin-antitoxin system
VFALKANGHSLTRQLLDARRLALPSSLAGGPPGSDRNSIGENWRVSPFHASALARLPLLHRDPFDRLLIAQAIVEPMRLTRDRQVAAYSELVQLV